MLGIADQERIHTQTIAWLLSPADSPLTDQQRARLMQEFFGISTTPEDANKIEVNTEWESLDMVIQHPNRFIVVENKMKSRQRENQLKEYKDKSDDIRKRAKIDTESLLIFLTFSGEKPQNDDAGWQPKDYRELLDAISKVDDSAKGYVADYKELLFNLTNARDAFLGKHLQHSRIIKKDELLRPNTVVEKFVTTNKLGRIFVEMLYREIIQRAKLSEKIVEIGESHGTALIQISMFNKVVLKGCSKMFDAGFQIQGDTRKYNISAENYKESVIGDLHDSIVVSLNKKFEQIGGLKSNPPRSLAYRSWSEKISKGKKLEETEITVFSNWLSTEYGKAKDRWERVLKELKEEGIVTSYNEA